MGFGVQPCDFPVRNVAQEKQPEEPLNTQFSIKVNPPNPPKLLNDAVDNYHTISSTAGQVKNHLCQWQTITQDHVILNAIQHYNIEFEESPPLQIVVPNNIGMTHRITIKTSTSR